MRWWVSLLLLCALRLPVGAQSWSEPVIGAQLMTAPLTPPPVTGTTFYVDKSNLGGTCNNANPGTPSQPWCTLGKALSVLTAGQAVLVRAGTYAEGNVRLTNSGSAGNYITIRAYPGEHPAINCTGFTFCIDAGQTSPAAAYVVWDGLELYGSTQQSIYCNVNIGCQHIWMVNGKYHDNVGLTNTLLAFYAPFIVISNNEIYNGHASGLGFSGDNGAHDVIAEFNTFHDLGRDNDDDGAVKSLNGYATVFRYNTAYNTYRNPSSSVACFQPSNCQGMVGIYLDGSTDNAHGTFSYVYNNVAYDNDIGIEVFFAQNTRVFNNLAYHNGFQLGTFNVNFGMGLTVDGVGSLAIELYNNTSVGNKTIGLNYGVVPNGQLTSRNNLSMNNNGLEAYAWPGQFPANQPNGNFDYDLFADTVHPGTPLIQWTGQNYTSLSSFQARGGNTTWLHAVGTAATFVNAGANDYHLAAGSRGINEGTAVALVSYDRDNHARPQGAAFDIGAYEYLTVGTLAPPTNLRVVP